MNGDLAYFSAAGPLTDPGAHAPKLHALPGEVRDLCRVVQGLVVHPFLVHLYGLDETQVRRDELELRDAAAMLARIRALDDRPLDVARPPKHRLVGNCRHFSVLLCTFLRARGVPARARCGFGAYFEPGKYVDHWVCEVWDARRGAWALVDAQLDAAQRETFGIPFDTTDVPRTAFIVAGDAWRMCRDGRADPAQFGVLEMSGLWFIAGNVVRDVAALAKRELLPWDCWGAMPQPGENCDAEACALFDGLAALTADAVPSIDELLALQAAHPGLRVPAAVVSANLGGRVVELPAGAAN